MGGIVLYLHRMVQLLVDLFAFEAMDDMAFTAVAAIIVTTAAFGHVLQQAEENVQDQLVVALLDFWDSQP